MRATLELWKEKIICPKCNTMQTAQVEFHHPRDPWPIYIWNCIDCGYEITESEWNPVPDIS